MCAGPIGVSASWYWIGGRPAFFWKLNPKTSAATATAAPTSALGRASAIRGRQRRSAARLWRALAREAIEQPLLDRGWQRLLVARARDHREVEQRREPRELRVGGRALRALGDVRGDAARASSSSAPRT